MKGNDGNFYKSTANKNGVYSWKLLKNYPYPQYKPFYLGEIMRGQDGNFYKTIKENGIFKWVFYGNQEYYNNEQRKKEDERRRREEEWYKSQNYSQNFWKPTPQTPDSWINSLKGKISNEIIEEFKKMIKDHGTKIGCRKLYLKYHPDKGGDNVIFQNIRQICEKFPN